MNDFDDSLQNLVRQKQQHEMLKFIHLKDSLFCCWSASDHRRLFVLFCCMVIPDRAGRESNQAGKACYGRSSSSSLLSSASVVCEREFSGRKEKRCAKEKKKKVQSSISFDDKLRTMNSIDHQTLFNPIWKSWMDTKRGNIYLKRDERWKKSINFLASQCFMR